ncbi:MAG: triose-phosphate isomerase, partial [Saprospiraceae bacterium]
MDLYRTKIVAGNWKMNTTLQEGEMLLEEILAGLPDPVACTVVIAPPLSHLAVYKTKLEGSPIKLGAQNCHHERSGAFTGEVSAEMLKSVGVEFVIVGHSERRQGFNETNEIIKLKLNSILDAGLKAIFCCGEPLEIRQSGSQNVFVRMQLEESLFHLETEQFKNVSIAYEPIWAIGTGVTASPEQAQEMHEYIRDQIANRYDKVITECTRILYGGSMKADNAKSLFTQ